MTTMYEKTLVAIDAAVEAEGAFSAVVATWGLEPDRQGDVIHRGAFEKSLDAWRRSAKKIPVVWCHETRNPSMVMAAPMRPSRTSRPRASSWSAGSTSSIAPWRRTSATY